MIKKINFPLLQKAMKNIKKAMNILENSIHLEQFDNLIDNFIETISFEISKYYHTGEYKKAKRLEKKVINFLQRVKISRKLYLGEI